MTKQEQTVPSLENNDNDFEMYARKWKPIQENTNTIRGLFNIFFIVLHTKMKILFSLLLHFVYSYAKTCAQCVEFHEEWSEISLRTSCF